MPDWDPNWVDVEFDHAAAHDAADALDAAAGDLSRRKTGILEHADHAIIDWTVSARGDFDVAIDRITDDVERIRRALTGAADDLRAGARRARSEQNRREADRDRWRRESEAETEPATITTTGPR